MNITILGCGNAFSLSTKNGNASFLLEEKDPISLETHRLLLDCGRTTPEMLDRAGIDVKTITHIYISHLHGDHIFGLEHLGFSRYDWAKKPIKANNTAPTLIANERLMNELWERALSGTMESLEGIDCTLGTFFHLWPIGSNKVFYWAGWQCRLVQQVHIMAGSIIKNAFGIIMEKPEHKTVYFVTDSQHCSPNQAQVFYKEADIIFQDCELIGVDTKDKTMRFCSNVHANYGQLATYKDSNSVILSTDIKKKMWLTHYQDFYNDNKDFFGNECDWNALAANDGFAGFVRVGQKFEI